jgi:glycosyltransferase involved in cell wall biosynthesis
MRVGLNLLYLLPGLTGGVGTYARNLINALARRDDGIEYVVFRNRESRSWELPASKFSAIDCPVNGFSRPRRYAFEQLVLPRIIQEAKLDVFHSLAYVGPVSIGVPHVVSVHDLNFSTPYHQMSAIRRLTLRFFVAASVRSATRLITISESSKRQICDRYRLQPSKVVVTYLAAREDLMLGDREPTEFTTKPYCVAFAGDPHKNIAGLIEAFALTSNEHQHDLVLIGAKSNGPESRLAERFGITSRVIMTGYLPDGALGPALRQADLFVFPSFYEGFGLPMLEAQQVGTPVACATSASLPEIAGGSAALFDPHDIPSMGRTISRLLESPSERGRLSAAGSVNVRRFSWDKTAGQTADVYRQAVQSVSR